MQPQPRSPVELSPAEAIRQGSKSFALASIFLPRSCREAAYQLYQWCRNCDDAIDEAPDAAAAKARLAELEDCAVTPRHLRAPDWVVEWHRAEFIAGLRMDVENRRYSTLADLEIYCFRVAGVVGLMMCPLLGADPVHAPPHAAALGTAMQLTNIARDIQADALMGRIYVPAELLPGVEPASLAVEPERARAAVNVLLARAEVLYEDGLRGIAWLPWRVALAIAAAGKIYQRIGHKLLRGAEKNPVAAFRQRTVVSMPGKLFALSEAVALLVRIKSVHWIGILTARGVAADHGHKKTSDREPPPGFLDPLRDSGSALK